MNPIRRDICIGIGVMIALLTAGCGTIAPKPVNATAIAWDENTQNAGIIDCDARGCLVTTGWYARYKELEKKHDVLLQLLEARGSLHGQNSADTGGGRYLKRFAVRDDNRYLLVNAEQVDWFDSAANYIRLHVGANAFLVRMTMNELEQKLDPQQFARIHRSTIVNIARVKEVTPDWHGEFDVKLLDGTNLRLTRTYRTRLLP